MFATTKKRSYTSFMLHNYHVKTKTICMNCRPWPRLAVVFSSNGNIILQTGMQRYAIVHAAMTITQKAGLSRSGSRAGLAANASYTS